MHPMPRNHPLHEAFVEALWPLLDAARAVLQDGHVHVIHTGDGCEHNIARDVLALSYFAETVEEMLGMALYGWPARYRRQAEKDRRQGREHAGQMYERMAERLEVERGARG